LILLRSIAFAAFFYLWSLLIAVVMAPAMLGSGRSALGWVRLWNSGTLFGLRAICGIEVEVRGREYIPSSGALIAAKHQCMFDAFAPLSHLSCPSLVGKQELARIPLFGWYAVRSKLMLVVDRKGHAGALRRLMAETRSALNEGRQLLIFPQGTRTPPGTHAKYKPGVAGLYRDLGVSCVPLATNAGVHWAPHGILRRPGKIVFEYLEPIPPGLARGPFMKVLEHRLEAAADALIVERA